jgi:HlyD family secretion protein
MAVRLEPSTARRDEYGMLLGRVQSVSPYPATAEGMAAVLHNADLAQRFRRRGAPYAAVVAFYLDPKTPSGYRWTSRRGPPDRLVAGALVRAEVETRRRRPIELLLPLARRLGRGVAG